MPKINAIFVLRIMDFLKDIDESAHMVSRRNTASRRRGLSTNDSSATTGSFVFVVINLTIVLYFTREQLV